MLSAVLVCFSSSFRLNDWDRCQGEEQTGLTLRSTDITAGGRNSFGYKMATGGAVYICVNFLCTCARLAEWSASQDLSAHCPACGFDPDGILLHLLFFLLLVIFFEF